MSLFDVLITRASRRGRMQREESTTPSKREDAL